VIFVQRTLWLSTGQSFPVTVRGLQPMDATAPPLQFMGSNGGFQLLLYLGKVGS
jgi:hypothetical protein